MGADWGTNEGRQPPANIFQASGLMKQRQIPLSKRHSGQVLLGGFEDAVKFFPRDGRVEVFRHVLASVESTVQLFRRNSRQRTRRGLLLMSGVPR